MANATINTLLAIVLLFAFVSQAYSQCSLRNLKVQQSQTGAKVQQKPEWNVTITSNCPCVQLQVMLNCRGFKSVERVNPSILRVMGNTCLVNAGNPISETAGITFKYAWDNKFPLTPISSQIACS